MKKKTPSPKTLITSSPTKPTPPERLADVQSVLRFTPTAWAKLLYFRDRQETEIGGFGITTAQTPLLVEDFVTVKQQVSVASVEFDDEAVADYFENQVDLGRRPEEFARLWLHTHPGKSPMPSDTDEETFQRVFGRCEWAVMFILARGGESFARLRFNVGPCGDVVIPANVDYRPPFSGSDHDAWEKEYQAHINPVRGYSPAPLFGPETAEDWVAYTSYPEDWLYELENMEPEERRMILAELAERPDLWEEMENHHEFI